MLSRTFAQRSKKAAGLGASAVCIFSLLLTFPSEPHILALRIGVVCAVVSSLGLLFYFWTNKALETIAISEAS
jgi:hypothetical protein